VELANCSHDRLLSATDIQPILAVMRSADAGQLDGLACPQCTKAAMYVSFTNAAENHYRVYFTCANCSYRMSGRHVGKPPYFSLDRVDPDLQAFDVETLRKMKFPDRDL
jgi:hypothetical protein